MKIFFLPAALALTVSAAIAADVTVEDTAQPVAEKPEFTWSGTYFGVHAGGGWANGAFSGFGVAVEGDIERHWNEQEVFGADFGLDWAGSLRGRVGYTFNNVLAYATAGWAGTRAYVDAPGLGKQEKTFSGYTIGAGLDYAFTDNMFSRIEYRYTDYGDKSLQGVAVDPGQHTVRVGPGIKF
ncbi:MULTISPECIES: outer membrane protein [Agrobacterium tumefaciens complex]|uniref:outer membrane protein n=1 Tax=Agrobacterium tumefaciens complex TaxID=1183400 RepID=UPI000DCFAB56|nr:outer membrane protein [Agrobacterium tumefaciens]MBP2536382.1 outer membrane immunogenic protein [Agrobacterium tumefaciens]MDP9857636.1 outer membrane immunogenic protein [Agrobacterium tumefaciens]TCV48580.1 outer membrane immunogenic protein [Agrobacterium tumefaciens]